MSRNFRALLHFSKKERRALLLLSLMLVIFRFAPEMYDRCFPAATSAVSLSTITPQANDMDFQKGSRNGMPERKKAPASETASKIRLFAFDPNQLNDSGWALLGLSPRELKSIRNYLSKGGSFRKPDDLMKFRGLHPALAKKLVPFVRIPPNKQAVASYRPDKKTTIDLDANTSDSAAFLSLPGIGPVLAGRLVAYRNKLGGFYELNQIREVYGIKDSVFDIIRPMLHLGKPDIKLIQINSADIKTMGTHPYLRNSARLIINYRNAHGPFASVDQLLLIHGINQDLLNKARPYLTL